VSRERAGTPGTGWERELRSLGEVVVPDDDGDSPFGWAEPTANRAARRAAKRRNRPSAPLRHSQPPGPPDAH
jgi:hypothetical protein